MKKNYYINKNQQANGDYEVHEENCKYLPLPQNRIFLGSFYNCKDAVEEAKRIYPIEKDNINCCKQCSEECHTS